MLLRHLGRSLGYPFVAVGLCSCAAATSPTAAATSPTDGGSQARTFESLGLLSCQTAEPMERFEAPACSSEALGCDAALVQRLDQLREACSYVLNENSIEIFFDDSCAVGTTEGRSDPDVTAEAKHCLSEEVAKVRAGCSRPLCVRLEHSTLAAR